jgi:hypothetical protein
MLLIPGDLWFALGGLMGLGVVGYIGNNVLINMGKKEAALWLNIILTIGCTIIGLDFALEYIDKVRHIFGI